MFISVSASVAPWVAPDKPFAIGVVFRVGSESYCQQERRAIRTRTAHGTLEKQTRTPHPEAGGHLVHAPLNVRGNARRERRPRLPQGTRRLSQDAGPRCIRKGCEPPPSRFAP